MEKISSKNIASAQRNPQKKLTRKHSSCSTRLNACVVNYTTSVVCVHSHVLLCQPMSVSTSLFLFWDPPAFQLTRTTRSWFLCLKSQKNNNTLESQSSRSNGCSRESSTWVPSTASGVHNFFPQTGKWN